MDQTAPPKASTSDSIYRKEQQQSLDSEKQVVSSEAQSGPENAPMVLEQEKEAVVQQPVREADKEVTSSWQTMSREDSAPIPVDSEPRSPTLSMKKEQPPSYDSLQNASSSQSAIEPDATADNSPVRPEDRSAVGQLLDWIPSSSRIPPDKMPRFEKPVIIPQLDIPPVGESVPFQRCYSDVLASHDIPMHEFVAFLDGLAIAQAPGSALQGLRMVGAGISMVPLPFIPLAGRGISALATVSSGHSGSRARLYLARAMKEYFAVRRIRLHIVKDDDLGPQWLRMPSNAPSLAPLTADGLTDSICTRRLKALDAYASPLRFDVPARSNEVKAVDKLATKHLSNQFSKNGKELAKLREQQKQGGAKGLEAEMEERKKCSRLKWIVLEAF